MSAGKKRNASHTWRAILFGREALNLGLIKRIGDGSTTRIWDDPWIPSNPSFKPIVKPTITQVTLVEELLNPITGQWKQDIVDATLVPVDARAVLSIPIGWLDEDMWAWHLEKYGMFSVRSAYKALIQAPSHGQDAGSVDANKSFWRKLWKMQVPPKVKNFWWRVIKAYIPCRAVLKGRHIEKLSFCKSCGRNEIIKHAMFECTWAKLFWNEIQVATSVKLPVLHSDS